MKHVLKRLSDGLDNHSVSVAEVVNFIGPKDVYYDTCDIQLTVTVRGIKDKIGNNHIFLFSRGNEELTSEQVVELCKEAIVRVENLVQNLDKNDLVKKQHLIDTHQLSLTILTNSLEEEFKLFVSDSAKYSEKEFNKTFGERYLERFKDFLLKQIKEEISSTGTDSGQLRNVFIYTYNLNLVSFFGIRSCLDILKTALTSDTKSIERYSIQSRILSELVKSGKEDVTATITDEEKDLFLNHQKELSIWAGKTSDQFLQMMNQGTCLLFLFIIFKKYK